MNMVKFNRETRSFSFKKKFGGYVGDLDNMEGNSYEERLARVERRENSTYPKNLHPGTIPARLYDRGYTMKSINQYISSLTGIVGSLSGGYYAIDQFGKKDGIPNQKPLKTRIAKAGAAVIGGSTAGALAGKYGAKFLLKGGID